eukprot:1825252-Pleurochrysis_carterae.AAC.2
MGGWVAACACACACACERGAVRGDVRRARALSPVDEDGAAVGDDPVDLVEHLLLLGRLDLRHLGHRVHLHLGAVDLHLRKRGREKEAGRGGGGKG